MNKKNKFLVFTAFTLAEVLITLGIIGIVTALTIPALISSYQEQIYKTAYKKAYSIASQALMKAYVDDLLTECSTWSDSGTNTCNANNFIAFKNELKVVTDCGIDTASCWDMSGEQSWGVYPTTSALAFMDTSGFAWSKLSAHPSGEILVDTNGNKKPNQYGKDRMIFELDYFNSSTMSQNGNRTDIKYGVPMIFLYPDFPDSGTDFWASLSSEQKNRCPSMATHPCYYTSWITGAR